MASTVAAEVGGSVADDVAGMAAENALAELLAVVVVGPGLPGEGWVGLAMGARGRDVAEIMGAERVIATVLAGMAAEMKVMAELLADVAAV